MFGKKINDINIGDEAQFSKTISESDVYGFAGIVGDFNPVHINKEYAKKTIFKQRIAHGIIGTGLISTVIGTYLPGEGTIYLSQSTKFKKPVYFEDTITAIVRVIEKNDEKNKIKLYTKCINQNDEIVIEGESLVMPPK
ncbi:MaoC family dehydratase [Clostridium estertheticum]|uniref:MaoC family dehydratase n=1 Tax=Clostridium estertheticum TaxID=238834 RepID=A0A5N7ISR4_9CLOT|nr:MaoC family dehydratase [Clostridium estertheticum]MBW9151357.1 MaoC family dehydratase [Clostridium estertheticum]MPQ33282.1 MaoC family dehydratase [Clostridium estertheticum]MPQ63940.1 MaoC family dehydratase [Clostridium estertheticum]WLC84668.1 MaoC family dehydratase [Clostridium estertheticum]